MLQIFDQPKSNPSAINKREKRVEVHKIELELKLESFAQESNLIYSPSKPMIFSMFVTLILSSIYIQLIHTMKEGPSPQASYENSKYLKETKNRFHTCSLFQGQTSFKITSPRNIGYEWIVVKTPRHTS